MATKSTVGLELRPSQTDAQRIARLQATHLKLLKAAERLFGNMEGVGERVYAVNPADVLALRVQVRESRRLYPVRNERTS
jgi:hypothetical protein